MDNTEFVKKLKLILGKRKKIIYSK